MEINNNILNSYLREFTLNPDSINNPSYRLNVIRENLDNLRIHETLAIYIFNNYEIEAFSNLDIEGKQNVLNSSGISFVDNSSKYIHRKKDNLSKYFFIVDATIVFKNQSRNLFFENDNFRTYTFSQNNWIVCDENIFNYIRFNDNIQFDNLYKIIENDTNKTSYLLFIDNNYDGDIDIDNFVQKRVNHSFKLLKKMLGTHGINKLSMGFTLMENNEHDNSAKSIFVDTVKKFLLKNKHTNSIMLIDRDGGFFPFDENQNFELV